MEDKKLKETMMVHDAIMEAMKNTGLPIGILGTGLYLAAVRFSARIHMALSVEARYDQARSSFEAAIELDRAIETAVAEALSGKPMK